MSKKSFSRSARTLGSVAMVVGLLGATLAAQPVPEKALECNSDIDLDIAGSSFMPGATVNVQMRLDNGESNDAGNNPVAQQWTQITFFPDCTAIMPTNPATCSVNPMPLLVFDPGSASTPDCASTPMTMVNPDGSVVFTFNPTPLVLPAGTPAGMPGGPTGITSCQIDFTATIDAAAPDMTMINALAVSAQNNCVGTGLVSFADGADTLTVMAPVPTLGAVAMVILLLTLLVGAWWLLRQQPLGGGLSDA